MQLRRQGRKLRQKQESELRRGKEEENIGVSPTILE